MKNNKILFAFAFTFISTFFITCTKFPFGGGSHGCAAGPEYAMTGVYFYGNDLNPISISKNSGIKSFSYLDKNNSLNSINYYTDESNTSEYTNNFAYFNVVPELYYSSKESIENGTRYNMKLQVELIDKTFTILFEYDKMSYSESQRIVGVEGIKSWKYTNLETSESHFIDNSQPLNLAIVLGNDKIGSTIYPNFFDIPLIQSKKLKVEPIFN